MQLLSINTGSPQTVHLGERAVVTGIDKTAVDSVEIMATGLAGDTIADEKNHGGSDQAVYVYTGEDYAYWETELQRSLRPGMFGDNLTISGMGDGDVFVGDRLSVGDVVLEITAPRIPCAVFANQMAIADMVARFRRAERPGYYCRVVTPGTAATGDAVHRSPSPQPTVTVVEVYRLHYDRSASADRIRSALEAPVAERTRSELEGRLARATG